MAERQRVVLITGCSAGIGLATVIELAASGNYLIWATMRDLNKRFLIDEKLSLIPNHSVFIRMLDVTNEESIQNVVDEIIKNHSKIDIVINNAGQALVGLAETTSIQQIQNLFDVNYFGVVRMLQAVLPHMRNQKSGVNTGLGFYGATKSALESLHSNEAAFLFQNWNIRMTLLQVETVETGTDHMAFRAEEGNRQYQEEGKQDLYREVLKFSSDYFKSHISQALPVTEQILDLLKAPTTDFKVQTQKEGKLLAEKTYVDPSGNEYFKDELLFTSFFLNSQK